MLYQTYSYGKQESPYIRTPPCLGRQRLANQRRLLEQLLHMHSHFQECIFIEEITVDNSTCYTSTPVEQHTLNAKLKEFHKKKSIENFMLYGRNSLVSLANQKVLGLHCSANALKSTECIPKSVVLLHSRRKKTFNGNHNTIWLNT